MANAQGYGIGPTPVGRNDNRNQTCGVSNQKQDAKLSGQSENARSNASPLIVKTTLTNLILVLVVAGPQLYDPHVRFDDYPALFGHPSEFYMKTLQEGRWINYIWHFRSLLWPAPFNYFGNCPASWVEEYG